MNRFTWDDQPTARVIARPAPDMFDIEDALLGIAEDRRYRVLGVLTGLLLMVCSVARLGPVAIDAMQDWRDARQERDQAAAWRTSAMRTVDPASPAGRGLLGDDYWDELRRLEGGS
jgi:hypothetical protein